MTFTAEIDSYQLYACREGSERGFQRIREQRCLQLFGKPEPSDDGIRQIHVKFFDKDPEGKIVVKVNSNLLEVNLPISDFADYYHILQTEDPIGVAWRLFDASQNAWFYLGTGREPLGEGLSDK